MPKPQRDLGEHERQEGLGRRVRRFVETELGRALDKGERPSGIHSSNREDEDQMRIVETGQAREPVDVGHEQVAHEQMAHEQMAHEQMAHEQMAHEQMAEPHVPVEEPAGMARDQERTSAERVGLLSDIAGLREQWRSIQGTFVDDPQQAVDEAGMLVDRMLDEIRTNVGSARRSESMSTEDLRMSFQRYREFFERLLSA